MTVPIKIISKKDMKKNFKQEDIWNSIAKPWKTYRIKTTFIVEEFLKGKRGKIIDLGCGSGRNMMANNDIEYYGVDFSQDQLKYAKEHIKKNKINAKLFKSDISKLDIKDFKNNMFDYGLFISTLHCLENPKQRLNSLKEFYRILKKNGEGLITIWNSEDKRFNSINNSGDIYMSWSEERVKYMRYYYLFSKKQIIDLLESVGFKILEFYKPREHDRFSKKNWIVRVKK